MLKNDFMRNKVIGLRAQIRGGKSCNATAHQHAQPSITLVERSRLRSFVPAAVYDE